MLHQQCLAIVCVQLASFAHWQLDKEPFNNAAFILDRVTRGIYLYDAGQ